MPIEERGAVKVYEVDELVIACAPADLHEPEVLDDVAEQRPDRPWEAYAVLHCNHDHPLASERRHWLLSRGPD